MKRRIIGLFVCFAVLLTPLYSATEPASAPKASKPVIEISQTIAAITGIAISPLLGTGVYGAYKYFSTDKAQRASLPWFAFPTFFLPALLIAGACAAKDTFGVVLPPGWKKPVDILETLENKLSGLVAAGAVVPITMGSLSKLLVGSAAVHGDPTASGVATIMLGSVDWSWALNILTVPLGVAVFAVVWMASHAINVLILLSPWAAIDATLKAVRTSILGLITLTTQLDPKSGAFLSLMVIVVAYFVSGWAFRLTTFGTLFCWDFFTRRKRRFVPAPDENLVFTGAGLSDRVPIRTYGRWSRSPEGDWKFRYRPWLVLPERSLSMKPERAAVGRGFCFSVVLADGENEAFTLPPRYRDHEEELARLYRLGDVQDVGLRKAWGWLTEGVRGKPRRKELAA
ncbi:hypothetical protein DB347_03300 [Opitutaceae bacterium EW11]|nr:hypothetical protein DB347_03300 [Opitutaceae bacterium EW11]